MTQNDSFGLNCSLFEGKGLDSVKVESLPPNIVKGKSYVVD